MALLIVRGAMDTGTEMEERRGFLMSAGCLMQLMVVGTHPDVVTFSTLTMFKGFTTGNGACDVVV